jgi:hypothetical protein
MTLPPPGTCVPFLIEDLCVTALPALADQPPSRQGR